MLSCLLFFETLATFFFSTNSFRLVIRAYLKRTLPNGYPENFNKELHFCEKKHVWGTIRYVISLQDPCWGGPGPQPRSLFSFSFVVSF